MKRNQILCISFTIMFCFASVSAGENALDVLTTPSNADSNACLLNLTYVFAANKVTFTVDRYIPNPSSSSCTYQDIVTAPIFYNKPFTPVNVNLQPPNASNPNHLTGTFTFAQMKNQLGQSCYLQYNNIQYTCKFKFSNIYFYLDLWLDHSNSSRFDVTGDNTGVLFPEIGSAMTSTKYSKIIWVANISWPHIIGKLEDGCGVNNWDNVVNSLSTEFTVTGTEFFSKTFDLHNYLNGTYEYRVLVLRNGSVPSSYKSVPTGHYPFNNPGVNNCTDTGITYGDFLQNLTYCANGCGISLGLFTSLQQFVLVTNGISTHSRLRT